MDEKPILKNLPHLPSIDHNSITASGFSAGGFFASNLHIIFSDLIKGVGIISGGPFGFCLDRT